MWDKYAIIYIKPGSPMPLKNEVYAVLCFVDMIGANGDHN